MSAISDLDVPVDIAQSLSSFLDEAIGALGDDFVSAVLFGSAAEGSLRATSDVNLMLVLARFDPPAIRKLGIPLGLAHASIRLSAMLILESELHDASECFAVKFADIIERHKILAGKDVIAGLQPSRTAMLIRLQQVLLNFVLRTRERYAQAGAREEQFALLVADAAGALRSSAAMILALQGRTATSPKAALEAVAREIDASAWNDTLARLSRARETGSLGPGEGEPTLLELLELARRLVGLASALS